MSPPVTTWSLELTDPARLRPPSRPAPDGMTIVLDREPGTSEKFYRGVGADWRWTDRLPWPPERWAAWERGVELHVVRLDGREAGYAELDPSQPGSVELAAFGLLPGFDGRGLGGHLLAHALRRALELAPRAWVHTCSLDGPHALANYEARGLVLFRAETAG